MGTLGLIGSGEMGGTVARLAVAAGLDVVLSNSRGPQSLSDVVDRLDTHATAATVEEAARAGDWVVLAVPFAAYSRIPVERPADKTVLETSNDFGRGVELAAGTATSSELVQRHLAGAHVVKALNTILPRQLDNLARPAGGGASLIGSPRPASARWRPVASRSWRSWTSPFRHCRRTSGRCSASFLPALARR